MLMLSCLPACVCVHVCVFSALEELTSDTDIDVQYFANQALKKCNKGAHPPTSHTQGGCTAQHSTAADGQ